MKNETLEIVRNFIEKTYSEKVMALYAGLSQKYKYFYVVQVFDDYCVVNVYDENTGQESYVRLSYSSEGDSYSFGEPQVVLPRYLTEQEIADWESLKNATVAVEEEDEDEEADPGEEDEDDEDFNKEAQTTVSTEGDQHHEEQGSQSSTSVGNHSTEQTEEGEKTEETKDLSKTSLIDSERNELETFRKEKKLSLISSFSKDLSTEFLTKLIAEVDKYKIDELEIILSKEFTRVKKEEENKETKPKNNFVPLSYLANKSSDGSQVLDLINRYKDKE